MIYVVPAGLALHWHLAILNDEKIFERNSSLRVCISRSRKFNRSLKQYTPWLTSAPLTNSLSLGSSFSVSDKFSSTIEGSWLNPPILLTTKRETTVWEISYFQNDACTAWRCLKFYNKNYNSSPCTHDTFMLWQKKREERLCTTVWSSKHAFGPSRLSWYERKIWSIAPNDRVYKFGYLPLRRWCYRFQKHVRNFEIANDDLKIANLEPPQ